MGQQNRRRRMSECESRYEVALVIEMQNWVFWTPTHCATLGKWNGREQGVSRRLTCALQRLGQDEKKSYALSS
jgi:hypothetical protein